MIMVSTAAEASELPVSAFSISNPEIFLFVVGAIFTFALFTLFVIILRKELKRDKQQKPSPGN